ncbi:hypothetical protein QJS10_CPA09g00903 [Acorus calamus]|uniref:Uncharacterized protein n=1 Tax=Acorus calamus TaxID=4465 RepID=A0AAV9E2Y3_ACOCL|nr:hypothetical protein QJS10_CPA09g00903 [Acorus calamus]
MPYRRECSEGDRCVAVCGGGSEEDRVQLPFVEIDLKCPRSSNGLRCSAPPNRCVRELEWDNIGQSVPYIADLHFSRYRKILKWEEMGHQWGWHPVVGEAEDDLELFKPKGVRLVPPQEVLVPHQGVLLRLGVVFMKALRHKFILDKWRMSLPHV